MRREPEFFGDQELVLVFVAKRLKEALALEKVLDEEATDYTVIPTPFVSGLLFPFRRIGAFFYVAPEMAEAARGSMIRRGFKPSL
jgi:hypothetical protein